MKRLVCWLTGHQPLRELWWNGVALYRCTRCRRRLGDLNTNRVRLPT